MGEGAEEAGQLAPGDQQQPPPRRTHAAEGIHGGFFDEAVTGQGPVVIHGQGLEAHAQDTSQSHRRTPPARAAELSPMVTSRGRRSWSRSALPPPM